MTEHRTTSARFAVTAIRALIALALLWAAGFVLVPWLVMQFHWWLGDPTLGFAPHRQIAIRLFALASAFSLVSAFTLVIPGVGAPYFFDSPHRLVTVGVYSRLRNPMALAALVQGAAVALYGGSYLLVAYVVVGVFVWAIGMRASEEQHLVRKFGREYEVYRRLVPSWLPTIRKFVPADDVAVRTLVVTDEPRHTTSGRRRRH